MSHLESVNNILRICTKYITDVLKVKFTFFPGTGINKIIDVLSNENCIYNSVLSMENLTETD